MERTSRGTSKPTVVSSTKYRKVLTALRIMAKSLTFIFVALYVLTHFKMGFSFHKAQTVKPAAIPTRFFPASSAVIDYPYGQLQPVINTLQKEELIFLMYYAPWCAESISIRDEYMKAAKVFQNTVKFIAVNCWYTEGECRKTMKIFAFPDLYVYHIGIDEGYRFTGPKKAELFVRFVESFLNPLRPLYTERQIQEFISKQDNTVIGYFDFNSSPQPPGNAFYQFYLAALRVMSYDFYQPIKFGVILVKRLADFFDIKTPDRFVMARIGNSTLKYPLFFNMTCRNITNWIYHYKQQNTVRWLVPPGIKSLTLSLALKQGPAMILVAPSNPMFGYNPYYDMIRLVSLQYNSCGNYTGQLTSITKLSVIHSMVNKDKYRQSSNKCRSVPPLSCPDKNSESKCCVSFLSGARTSNSVCEYCVQKNYAATDTVCDMEWASLRQSEMYSAQLNTCSHSYKNYNINEHHSVSCRSSPSSAKQDYILNNEGKKLRKQTDPYVINAVQSAFRLQCNKFSLQKLKRLVQYENVTNLLTSHSDLKKTAFITGQSCVTNRTLSYYFMDSMYHSIFVERLGIPVKRLPNKATVILIDGQDEATYHLQGEVTHANLVRFVSNYTEGLLDRDQLSAEITSPDECGPQSTSVCVIDVSMETFSSVVLDNDKDIVLLYYTPWCGFCSHFAHTFLAVAKYFSPYKNITFARFDASNNDLPWELTADKYPTVILFPAQRKADSLKFPDDIPKSVPNLIKFILYHSTHQLQLESAMNICSKECIDRNKKLALEEINRLQKLLSQLKRRLLTLTQYLNTEHEYFFVARATIREVYEVRNVKLRRAQQLNYFLENNIKLLHRLQL